MFGQIFSEARRPVREDELAYALLETVAEIPAGCVATYGQLAALIGRPRHARLVGRILSRSEFYGRYPCHRVVDHAGRTAHRFPEQRWLLEREGVVFRENGCVDLSRYGWDPESDDYGENEKTDGETERDE